MKNTGFTLIELLIVVAVLSILSSVVVNATNNGRARARDTERLANIKQIERALFLYHTDNGSYPISPNGAWAGNAEDWGGHSDSGPTGYIPNLAPNYISRLPIDPKQENNKGYIYKSDGTDYFFLVYKTLERLIIPDQFKRPSNPESNDLAIYTPGFANQEVPGEDQIDSGDGGGVSESGSEETPEENNSPNPPSVKPEPGTYFSDQSLEFYSDDGSVSIYYVYDTVNYPDYDFAEKKGEGSYLYQEPFVFINESQVYYFKAVAFKDDLYSEPFYGQYIIIGQ